ncbi:Crp/Fnr family transcriptional regulator [Edaphobacter aggregans]|uniref:Crp/Fnr family transcriptional regulator n=1 Tax=Edaphobacter aggregans TaxID=570835 RepID=UPI001FE123CE|nr:Crp/Fnr family transcriptional regulator [Edaphobacter aggregans]
MVGTAGLAGVAMGLERQPRRASSSCASCEYRSLRMFCNLSPEQLYDLDSIGVQWRLPKGAIFFQEEDPSDHVAVLCDGQVKLSCTSAEGKTLILKIAGPGDVLGLGAAIAGSPYEVTAEAIQPTLVKNIRRDDFIAFLERHGEASMHATRSLSDEYKAAFDEARRLALSPSAAGRLASVLLQWGRSACCGKPEIKFTMALTHEELASLAGTSRETVTRVLSRLQRENLIHIHGTSITILAPEKLAQLS